MQDNILRDSLVTHIYLTYTELGRKQVHKLKLRFIDAKQAYFSAEAPVNFEKPKRKTPAEIKVYTVDGVYRTEIFINDAQLNVAEVLFEVSIPKMWEFIQMRNSSRSRISLPIHIKYNDGFEINTTTYDIALGGLAFYLKDTVNGIYEKLPAIVTLELPQSCWIKNPSCKVFTETCFVRKRLEKDDEEHFQQYLYSYKFINLTKEAEESLKDLLLQRID